MSLFLALTTLTVVAASIVFDWWYFSWLRSKRLPPGPAPWPIVGNIFQRGSTSSKMAMLAAELQAKYGRITTFWIGRTPVIFVTDPALTYDALVKQGFFFANRIKLHSQGLLSSGFRTLSTSEGPWTAALRKNVMTHMLGPAKLKAFKHVRDAAYESIISAVKSAGAKDGVAAEVSLSSIVRYHLMKFVLVLALGVELEDDLVQEITSVMTLRIQLSFRFRLGDHISAYRIFERKTLQLMKDNHKRCEELLAPIIDRLRTLQGDKSVISGNYCETLFQLEEEFPVANKSVTVCLCCEFLNASVQTTTEAVDKAVTALSEHPDVQTKLFKEIEATVGNKRPVDESDLPDLPYLSAVVRETLRRYPPARLSLPHATSETRMLGGYEIPSDAIILFGLEALHLDPTRWSDPLAFKPERFVETDLDVLGTRDFSFLPFSAGRRVCPGHQVAMLELSVTVARLVQAFEWGKPSSANKDGSGPNGSVLCARPRST